MTDIEQPTATTIGELGMAFAHRNQLDDERNQTIKDTLKTLTQKIDEDIKSKADKDYVDEIKKDLDTLTNNAVTKAEFRIGLGVVTTALTIISAVIALWKSLTGN